MKDERKTKKQLVAELRGLRQAIARLETLETERSRAQELAATFKTISDNARHGVLISDLAGNIIYINEYFARVHGYGPEEVVGKNLALLHNVRQLERVIKMYEEAEAGRTRVAQEVWHTHKDGSVFPMLTNTVILKNQAGKPLLIANTAIDMTKWKRAEEALKESEARFAVFMNRLHAGVYIKDENSRFLYVNQYMKDLFDAGAWVHQISVHHFPKAIAEAMIEDDRRVLAGGPLVTVDQVVDRSGAEHVFETYKFPIKQKGSPTLLGGIALDITERKRAEEKLQSSVARLQGAMEAVIRSIAVASEMRDPYTAGHQRRVTQLACAIAQEIGLSDEGVRGIRMAGLIHDIGKIHVPSEILSKPGRLTALEFGMIQSHPQVGYDILKAIDFPWPIAKTILQHHERFDGSGYPRGLLGEDTLLEARILSVADVVEATCSHRPYRPALGIEEALREIERYKGTHYDPAVVEACVRVFHARAFRFKEGTPSGNEPSG